VSDNPFNDFWKLAKENMPVRTFIVVVCSIGFATMYLALRAIPEFWILKMYDIPFYFFVSLLLISLSFMAWFYVTDLIKDDWIIVKDKSGNEFPMPYIDLKNYNKITKRKLRLKYRDLTDEDYKKYPYARVNEYSEMRNKYKSESETILKNEDFIEFVKSLNEKTKKLIQSFADSWATSYHEKYVDKSGSNTIGIYIQLDGELKTTINAIEKLKLDYNFLFVPPFIDIINAFLKSINDIIEIIKKYEFIIADSKDIPKEDHDKLMMLLQSINQFCYDKPTDEPSSRISVRLL
jgi:hypothetical protein